MIFEVRRASVMKRGPDHPPCRSWPARYEGRAWVVEIDTLDDLLRFIEAEGDDIVVAKGPPGGRAEIMIYDDYLE